MYRWSTYFLRIWISKWWIKITDIIFLSIFELKDMWLIPNSKQFWQVTSNYAAYQKYFMFLIFPRYSSYCRSFSFTYRRQSQRWIWTSYNTTLHNNEMSHMNERYNTCLSHDLDIVEMRECLLKTTASRSYLLTFLYYHKTRA